MTATANATSRSGGLRTVVENIARKPATSFCQMDMRGILAAQHSGAGAARATSPRDLPAGEEMDDHSEAPAGALRIDAMPVAAGMVGMCHLPGRRGVDDAGRTWSRVLDDDLAAIEAWGAAMLLTLVEDGEFARYGVPGFAARAQARRFAWLHLPIADMQPPGEDFERGWRAHGEAILGALARGERVAIHCVGGRGRSGTIAARIAVAFGAAPAEAIARVRAARAGAIETRAQELHVLALHAGSR